MTSNPFIVTYSDLIKEAERELVGMKKNYPSLVGTGQMSEWTKNHRIAAKEQIIRLLKRHKKDPQLNMEGLFEKLK